MSDITELGKRITAALDRIERGLADLPSADSGQNETAAELTEALETERQAAAQLAERLRLTREQAATESADLTEKLERLTRQLDQQGLEIQTLRKRVFRLRDAVRSLREAHAEGITDAELINRAMQAELDALSVTRQSEIFEIDEILAELRPLVLEVQDA